MEEDTRDIVTILMERDDIDRKEAVELVIECKEGLEALALGHTEEQVYSDEQDVIQEILGLEPDYLFEILAFEGK